MAKKTVVYMSLCCLIGLAAWSTIKAAQPSSHLQPTPVPLPGGSAGIGFDDLGYSPDLKKVIIPAGRSGNLDLIDPKTLYITAISGFSAQDKFGGGHGEGTTSADAGPNLLFATDHAKQQVDVVDPATRTILTSAAVADDPDYIRYVSNTNEVWVTQPDRDQIEVFSLSDTQPPTLAHAAFIGVSDGPESL